MSWATKDQVLDNYRMLTRREAFIRQVFVSIAGSIAISSLCFIYLPVSVLPNIILISLLFYFFFDILGTIYFKSKKQEQETNDNENRRRSLLEKINLKSPVMAFISVVFASLLIYIVIDFPKIIFFAITAVLNAGSLYLAVITLLSYIEKKEIDEFSNDLIEKLFLYLQRKLSFSRGYYFIGEVAGKKIGLPHRLRLMHTLVAGPTGEGKSSSLIIPPLLFDADSSGSAVVPDAKSPELFNWVAGRWLNSGKRVFLFDCWHPDCIGINPLIGADDQDLLTIVEVLMREREDLLKEDPFFKSRTRYLLFAILKLVQSFKNKYCNLSSLYYVVESVPTLESYIATAPDIIKKNFEDFYRLAPETKVNALTSIRDRLDIFMDGNVRKGFSKSEFMLDMLFREKEPCLLIIGAPIDKKDPGTKIASLIVNLIINMAFKERRLYKLAIQRGEKSFIPSDLFLYLDELRNLKITQLANLVAIARETHSHIIGSVTDLGFFRYYREDYDSLMGNFRTRIFLGGLDYNSARYVSDSLGKVNTAVYRYFRGLMASQEQRQVLEADKIMNFPEDKIIVFSPKAPPFCAKRLSVYNSQWLRKMRVPPPKNLREYYRDWKVADGDLMEPILPTKGGKPDFEEIKGDKKEEELRTSVTRETFKESGGGKVDNRKHREPERETPSEASEKDAEANTVASTM